MFIGFSRYAGVILSQKRGVKSHAGVPLERICIDHVGFGGDAFDQLDLNLKVTT